MKRIRKMVEPTPGLSDYLKEPTTLEYKDFRNYRSSNAYKELLAELVSLQRGLCGYCEANIPLHGRDHQIEHVAPQSIYPEAALRVSNMIACCAGGTVKSRDRENVSDPRRHNQSCGQAKGDSDDQMFFDPRQLPALPSLLVVRSDGRIEPDGDACQSEDEIERVKVTIKILGLNVGRLRAARERRWRDLLDVWARHFQDDDAMAEAARRELLPRQDGRLARFFTTRRSFFGRYGEQALSVAPDSWV